MASIKDLKRMCESYGDYCTSCPLHELKKLCAPNTIADNADEIVDKWVSEHPTKTYAMDFFSKFPDAQRKATTGIPIPCIRVIYSEFYDRECPKGGCYECWNREMIENDDR